ARARRGGRRRLADAGHRRDVPGERADRCPQRRYRRAAPDRGHPSRGTGARHRARQRRTIRLAPVASPALLATGASVKPTLRRREVPDVPLLADAALHPVLARVYAARGVQTRDQLDLRLSRLLTPSALGGLDRACALLREAIAGDARILVVGDF